MESITATIVVGIINAIGAIVAALAGALVGALVGRSNVLDRIISGPTIPRLTGKWKCTWIERTEEDGEIEKVEIFTITKQKKSRVYGHIDMQGEPDKKWDLEGDFNGRFLRLFWTPSRDAEDKLFLDYGCYFFQLLGDGTFEGHAVGYDWETNKIERYKHKLSKV